VQVQADRQWTSSSRSSASRPTAAAAAALKYQFMLARAGPDLRPMQLLCPVR